MSNYFLCDYCSDYICDSDDFIACDCGLRWCSIRCAKLEGYQDRKRSSTCDYCRDEPGNITNYLFTLNQFVEKEINIP